MSKYLLKRCSTVFCSDIMSLSRCLQTTPVAQRPRAGSGALYVVWQHSSQRQGLASGLRDPPPSVSSLPPSLPLGKTLLKQRSRVGVLFTGQNQSTVTVHSCSPLHICKSKRKSLRNGQDDGIHHNAFRLRQVC